MKMLTKSLGILLGVVVLGFIGGKMGTMENVKAAASCGEQAPVVGSVRVNGKKYTGSRAKVYYTQHIDAEHLLKLYELVNDEIYGKVAIKLHTG